MWAHNGIEGRDNFPPRCMGNFSGTAVVLGCGRSVWNDLELFNPEKRKAQVIAVNNMILHFKDRVHHGVSLHPEEPALWRALRPYYQCEGSHVTTHGYRHHGKMGLQECDYLWQIEGGMAGTSGLFAAMVGLALGYSDIVLAGVPLDGGGHFYDPPGLALNVFNSDFVKMEWQKAAANYFQGRVKSCSGWTREVLGAP